MKTNSILWMAEQLDFGNQTTAISNQLEQSMTQFLGNCAGTGLSHSVYPA